MPVLLRVVCGLFFAVLVGGSVALGTMTDGLASIMSFSMAYWLIIVALAAAAAAVTIQVIYIIKRRTGFRVECTQNVNLD